MFDSYIFGPSRKVLAEHSPFRITCRYLITKDESADIRICCRIAYLESSREICRTGLVIKLYSHAASRCRQFWRDKILRIGIIIESESIIAGSFGA